MRISYLRCIHGEPLGRTRSVYLTAIGYCRTLKNMLKCFVKKKRRQDEEEQKAFAEDS